MATTQDYGATFTEFRLTTEVHSNELRRGVCWGLGEFVAVGGSDQRRIWTSPDGLVWNELDQDYGWIADCASNGSQVVATGGFHVLSETSDLVNWTLNRNNGVHFRTAAYGNGHYVAVGGGEAGVSTDGVSWANVATLGVNLPRSVAFGHDAFVAVSDAGWISTSIDNGFNWTSAQISTANFSSVIFDGTHFFAGDGASVYRSSDGLSWDRVNASGGVIPRGAVGNTIFGTGNGAFYRSSDGAFSWELLYTFTNGSGFNDAVFAGEE